MALVKWDPFRDMVSLQNSINKLFDDNFKFMRTPEGAMAQGMSFPVDIKESQDAVIIKAELPGFNKEDIKVSFVDNVLTIRGDRKREHKEEGASFIRVERSYGSFSRSFNVDIPVKQDGVKARYQDGVLEVTLAKEAETQKKEYNIEIEG